MQSGQRTTSSKLCQFLQTLDRLRANPEDDALWSEATAEGLKWIVAHLASDAAPLGPQSGYGHFYCQRGFHIGQPTDLQPVAAISVETMADIRSFLLRLISYKPKGFSAIWRDAFEACLQGCVDCAVGLGECMITLANKLSAFSSYGFLLFPKNELFLPPLHCTGGCVSNLPIGPSLNLSQVYTRHWPICARNIGPHCLM